MFVPAENWVQAKPGSDVEVKVAFELKPGYHTNSNTPSDPYLIPFKLIWDASPMKPAEVVYPKPRLENYSFSKTPLSVFTEQFKLTTRFTVPANAPSGPTALTGKVRYQACNDSMCLPPKNLDVKVQVNISK